MRFHNEGGGIFIWADNDPLFYHVNYILPDLCDCYLIDDTPADRVLSYGNPLTPGEFDEESLVFAGIDYLYEGITICYPVDKEGNDLTSESKLKVLATSSNGKPCICVVESQEGRGRVMVDTGFTKMYSQFWRSSGQSRYVVNACVYLCDIERS